MAYRQKPVWLKQPKYKNKKYEVNGYTFDSEKEGKRYEQLFRMQQDGQISNLQLQVKLELLPIQREPDTIGKRGGVRKGRVLERPVTYIADFVYKDSDGNTVVEDAKGFRTKEYRLKRKLCLWRLGIRIHEV